jgi:hypothetical protein
MLLTDTQICKAPACEKTQQLFDGQGLYLEIAPSGGKWWRLKYPTSGWMSGGWKRGVTHRASLRLYSCVAFCRPG